MALDLVFLGVAGSDRDRLEEARKRREAQRQGRDAEVTLFAFGPEAPSDHEQAAFRDGYSRARDADRAVVGVLTGGVDAPSAEQLPSTTGGLAAAPWIDLEHGLEDLEAVLDALAPAPLPVPAETRRPPTRRRTGLERDPVLMRIATTSGGIGLLLLGTLGLGPASLFLFLSVISFSISRLPAPDEDGGG